MVRLTRIWGEERVYSLTELVKKPDFPFDRDARTIRKWAVKGVKTERGSRVAFPTVPVNGARHSSVEAAKEFLNYLGNREPGMADRATKVHKRRQKGVE